MLLRAQAFVLIDSDGHEKARLSCDDAGAVRLLLGSAGSGIALVDTKQRDRLRLELRQDGSPIIALVDENGFLRCDLTLLSDGAPALVVATLEGELQMKLLVSRKPPRLELIQSAAARRGRRP